MGASLCLFGFVRRISGSVYAAAITRGLVYFADAFEGISYFSGIYGDISCFLCAVVGTAACFSRRTGGQQQHSDDICRGPERGAALSFKQVALFDVLGIVIITSSLLRPRYKIGDVTKSIVLLLFGVMVTTGVGILLMKANAR